VELSTGTICLLLSYVNAHKCADNREIENENILIVD
jgi:hypothetical protein